MTPFDLKDGRPRFTRLAALASEAFLSGTVLFAMNNLAGLGLSAGGLAACWLPWLICLAGAGTAWRLGRGGWPVAVLQLAGPGLALVVVKATLRHPLTYAQIGHATLTVTALTAGWHLWLGRAERRGCNVATEAVRLLAVAGTAIWVMLPLFTDRWVSGVDARWYAYMLQDYLEQLRSGVFPVLIGQGEFAWNGGVHPFRSAPVYLWLGGLWDLLTFRSLHVMALQHLTAITSALAGGLGLYATVGALAPGRRWLAMGTAIIYTASPGFLGPLYFADQYMTFMTLGALPLLLLGNARMFEREGNGGWPWLAVGLAAVWFCHPPVAILSSLATILIQGGRLLLSDSPGRDARRALLAAGLFVLLAGHYFVAMSEVPSPLQPLILLMVAQLAGLALGIIGLARGMVWGERWGWLALAAGAVLLWRTQPAFVPPLVIATLLVAVIAGIGRKEGRFDPRAQGGSLALGALLAAGFLGALLWDAPYPGYSADTLALLGKNTRSWLDHVRPLSAASGGAGAVQPGWGVMFLLAALAGGAVRDQALRTKLFFAAVFLLGAACFRVPGLSEFWLAHLPRALAEMAGLPLINRLVPPLVAFACAGGALALGEWAERNKAAYRVALAGLLVLAGWSQWHAWPYVKRGWQVTHTRQDTANQFRLENAVLDRFAYDLMMMPAYVSNGKTDPRLESRLFVRAKEVGIGPDEIARRMEAAGVQEHRLTSTVEPGAPAWLNLSPALTLAPGGHLLLRFEFLPKTYEGWLIVRGPHTYREYQLPDSGWQGAFGVHPERSKTISLWNSGAEPEEVKLSFQRSAAGGEFGDFARLFVSHYRPELAPVRTLSLQPYKVEVAMPAAGWLETPRTYLPGYVARVDGREAEAGLSPRWLMWVPLDEGTHVVELNYRGTLLFRCTWWLSVAAWVATLVWLVRRQS